MGMHLLKYPHQRECKKNLQDWRTHVEILGLYKITKYFHCVSEKERGVERHRSCGHQAAEYQTWRQKTKSSKRKPWSHIWWAYISLSAIVSAEAMNSKISDDTFKTQKEKRKPASNTANGKAYLAHWRANMLHSTKDWWTFFKWFKKLNGYICIHELHRYRSLYTTQCWYWKLNLASLENQDSFLKVKVRHNKWK